MNDNDNFKINLKKEEFQIIYKNINEIFNGNFTTFVSEIKISKPFLLDLIILLRKYQYFILYILLNKKELAIFNKKENEGKINNILNMKQMMRINEKNEFIFNLNILPKFKKSEINFLIPNDLINLKIKMIIFLNGNNSLIFEECEVEALNLIKSFNEEKYKKLNKILSKILDVFCLENKLNPFNSLNKYLNYIENYLPKIFEKKEENVNNNNNNINNEKKNISRKSLQLIKLRKSFLSPFPKNDNKHLLLFSKLRSDKIKYEEMEIKEENSERENDTMNTIIKERRRKTSIYSIFSFLDNISIKQLHYGDFAYKEEKYKYLGNTDAKNNKTGFGVMIWKDKSKLKGHFKNNKINGFAEFMDHESLFSGYYKDNSPEGYGIYEKNNVKTEGETWIKNNLNGIGIQFLGDNDFYLGDFFQTSRFGIGI